MCIKARHWALYHVWFQHKSELYDSLQLKHLVYTQLRIYQDYQIKNDSWSATSNLGKLIHSSFNRFSQTGSNIFILFTLKTESGTHLQSILPHIVYSFKVNCCYLLQVTVPSTHYLSIIYPEWQSNIPIWNVMQSYTYIKGSVFCLNL